MALFDLPLAELETYLPPVDEPADLDAFWTGTLAAARSAGGASGGVVLAADPVETGLRTVRTWDVTFAGHGGDPIRAWYSRPAHADDDTALPVVVEYLGYGRGRGLPQERLVWPSAGYGHLLMDTRGQGSQYGSGGATPDPVGSGPATPGSVTRGIESPETAYWTRLVTDAVRAVDAARALPGADPRRTAIVGNSQGGGLAVAVSGLVPDLAAVMPSAPFFCHVPRALAITDADPYSEIVRYLSVHRGAVAQTMRTISYLDGMHLARRATAPALFSTGLRDTICPPSTAFATLNHYGGLAATAPVRDIEVYPFNHHEGGEAFHAERLLHWLPTHLPLDG